MQPGDQHSYTLFIPPVITAPLVAREFVAVLRSLDLAHIADKVKLCTCELVTNTYRHAVGTIGSLTWLAVEPNLIRVSVYDGSPEIPIARRPNTAEDTGRGLLIVADLADKWGVELGCPLGLGDTGKGVWFECLL